MTRPLPSHRNAAAFTLIEVLLAVAVFAIVIGAINSVFFGALRLRNKTIESFETALPLQQALSFLRKDIEGIMIPGGRFSGSFTSSPESMTNSTAGVIGERVTPDIYTSSGSIGELARWSDIQKVSYFLTLPTNSSAGLAAPGKDLVRQVTRNLLPVNAEEPEAQFLMSGVQTMLFEYYDGMAWATTWTATNLPSAIKVQLTLDKDYTGSAKLSAPIQLVVPISARASTNSTEQTGGGQ